MPSSFFKRDICELKSRFTAQAYSRCMLWIYGKFVFFRRTKREGGSEGRWKEGRRNWPKKKKKNEKKHFAGPWFSLAVCTINY